MKKLLFGAVVLALFLGRSALPAPREMENMALFRTLGVDTDTVTTSTGLRAGQKEEKSLVLSAPGKDLDEAMDGLQARCDGTVFLGYVDQVLVGEELARQSLTPLMERLRRDGELSLSARLWVVRGDTAKAGVDSGGDRGVEQRLNTLRLAGADTRTAGEIWADLLDRGTARVPALKLKDGLLSPAGWAVLKEDRLVGFVE